MCSVVLGFGDQFLVVSILIHALDRSLYLGIRISDLEFLHCP